MISALKEAFLYELKSIRNSWYKLALMTILPIICFILIISIFSAGVLEEMPIAVVDNDKSELSRMLLTNVEASSTVQIAHTAHSMKEAIDLVKQKKAYAVIVIPTDFEKDTLLQKHPTVTTMVNTQFILMGDILASVIASIIMESSSEVEYVQNLVHTQNTDAAIHDIAPITVQATPFFNTYQNYFYFLVTALLPSIWQMSIVLSMLVSIGVIFKYKNEKIFCRDNKYIASRLIGLMLPYTMAYMLMGSMFLFYIYSMWAFQGSFAILLFGMLLTTVAYQVIALFVFMVLFFNYEFSLSFASVYTTPAFAFLGITFPTHNMNEFAVFWSNMLPISHYMKLQLSQANYGVPLFLEADKLWFLFAFWIFFIPAVILLKIKMTKELK